MARLYPNGWPRTMQAALYWNRKNRLQRIEDSQSEPEPVPIPKFPIIPSDLASIIGGALASNIWNHNQDSGASVDHVGGINLTPVGATVGVVTSFGDGDKCVKMTDNTGHRVEAANNTIFDETTTSWALLRVLRFTSLPSGSRHSGGKVGTRFYTHRFEASGNTTISCSDGTNIRTMSSTIPVVLNQWIVVGSGIDRVNGLMMSYRNGLNNVQSVALSGLGSLTNTGIFAVGRSSVSAPQEQTYMARFSDVQAVNFLSNLQNAVNDFASHIGV